MNARSKRIFLRCIRIGFAVTLVQIVLVFLVTLHLRAGYPGVTDVSDYVPSGHQSYVVDTVRYRAGSRKRENTFSVPRWQTMQLLGNQSDLPLVRRNFFLTQVLHVRIYTGDKANWTVKELKQWMHYMYYAGVEHIFICDHAQKVSEMIRGHLANYIKLEFVTYIHWPMPRNVVQSKLDCYRYFMKELEGRNEWQGSVDMDEYPFVVGDQAEGFLARYLRSIKPDVVQVLMENYLMLDEGDRNRSMVIERITRRTLSKANKLTKPLYRTDHTRPGMHRFYERRNTRRYIRTELGDPDDILMLHYWGKRLQRMGQDIAQVIHMTEQFTVMRDKIAPHIRNSLIAFGEFNAFSNQSGP